MDNLMPRPALLLVCAALGGIALGGTGCSRGADGRTPATREARPASPVPASPPDARRPRVVCLGDSLTAGLGLEPAQSLPSLLQAKAQARGLDYEVVNAGVSGDTTAGALRRLDWALEGDVRVLVVALGANDGLRGLPVAELRKNLDAILRRARERGVRVLLAGMEVPPNLGSAYATEFRQAFRDLAAAHGVSMLPFLLEDVAGRPALNQADGIHPNAEGTRRVAENVWRALEPLLVKPRT